MKPASYYIKLEDKQVHCLLCPHSCVINADKTGFCEVRKNFNGTLMTLNYGRVSAINFDPIENKPLYHFYPGSSVLSVGSVGCNFHCLYCQTHTISQTDINKVTTELYTLYEIVTQAEQRDNTIGIAYTYNEPVIWFEYMLDIAKLSNQRGLKNCMISNGFINPGPLTELFSVIDAFNIDIKGFSEEVYRKISSADLSPVKETLKKIRHAEKHLEVSYLVIPTYNDNLNQFEKMIKWIYSELGENTILHLTKYNPRYRLNIPGADNETMSNLYYIAKEYLHYVYIRNLFMDIGHNTICPACNNIVIKRAGFNIQSNLIKGICSYCGKRILTHY